jgi:hypothetical protein
MKILQAAVAAVALTLAGGAWAGPIPEGQESAVGFRTFDLPAEQTGTFEVSFDATPLADNIDAFTGIGAITPREAGDVAAIVRFNEHGTIDVRNGGAFRADQRLAYTATSLSRAHGDRHQEPDLFGFRDPAGRDGSHAGKELCLQKHAGRRENSHENRAGGLHGSERLFQGAAPGHRFCAQSSPGSIKTQERTSQ